MQILPRCLLVAAILLSAALWIGCDRKHIADSWPEENSAYVGKDKPRAEEDALRWSVRPLYNGQRFDALEKKMVDVRSGPQVFGNGVWPLYIFYQSLRCRETEPENMWKLHETIHEHWEKAMPESVTALVAHADFLTEYAWHARGDGPAGGVTEEGWHLFRQRLVHAQEILDKAKPLTPRCPMWWLVEMRVALGQSWKRADFDRLVAEARQVAPAFPNYDLAIARFLAPQWYGRPGEWEKAAEADIRRPGGLGLEGNTRVVCQMRGYYNDIFKDTQVSWPTTRAGFEDMRKKYPQSLAILSTYCEVACEVGDRPLARKLFDELNDYVDQMVWVSPSYYSQCHRWAFEDKS